MRRVILAIALMSVAVSIVFALGIQQIKPAITSEVVTTYVYNGSGGSLANGDVVVWVVGTSSNTVTTTVTAANKNVAGVVIKDIADGECGYIQIYGYNPAIKVSTMIGVGDLLGTSDTAKKATSSSTLGSVFGVSYETKTDSTTVKGFIKAMGQ